MKKILITIFIAASLISCEDSLDRSPIDQLTPETAYQSIDDLEFGLSGIYNAIPTNDVIALNSIMSDNTKIGLDNGGQQVALFNFEIAASNGLDQGIFADHYYLINLCSRLIAQAEELEIEEGDLNTYNYALAQAYALRAYGHYEIMRHYTPDLLDPSSISVPYVDFVAEATDFPARNTVAEVKEGIFSDISMAEDLIGGNGSVDRINPDFLTFLRARMEIITGNNLEAITLANSLIAQYPLANPTQYENMFLDQDNTEVIFKKVLTQADVRIGGVWYFTGTGGAFIEMSNELYNLLNPADVRFGVLFDQAESDPANNVHLIDKYPGSGGFNYLNDYKAMRISEMHLIKAEAQARENLLGDAAQSIKNIRDARLGTNTSLPSYGTRTEALRDILAERRVELAFEGHRYVDVKRFRNDVNEGFVRDPLDCAGAAPCTIAADDFRFTLPLPFNEVTSNPNINQNNPGY